MTPGGAISNFPEIEIKTLKEDLELILELGEQGLVDQNINDIEPKN